MERLYSNLCVCKYGLNCIFAVSKVRDFSLRTIMLIMIQVQTSIHDRFSVEFKTNFIGLENEHLYKMNSWLFVPASLDINASTYSKEQFYRDVKSNVRLKTPFFTLKQMAEESSHPVRYLKTIAQTVDRSPASSLMADLEFHVKMYVAIYKSALRDETKRLQTLSDEVVEPARWFEHLAAMRTIVSNYRTIMASCDSSDQAARIFHYGDEYLSHLTELYSVRMLRHAETMDAAPMTTVKDDIRALITAEHQYKVKSGYEHFSIDSESQSRDMFHHQNTLKKYIESALYLKTDSEPDGAAAQQLTFGVAAGLAMLISMLIALPFQKYLGDYPTLIFIILVVAYMFKDRIKEYARVRFAHRLKSRFFDLKNNIFFRGRKVVNMKEGVDFIDDAKTPEEVLAVRRRTDLEGRIPLEQIILYRKQVDIDEEALRQSYEYRYDGINDITRIHFQYFTLKMDDPETTVSMMDEDGSIVRRVIPRVYNLYIVLQCVVEEKLEYHCFKLMMSRDGIRECVEI